MVIKDWRHAESIIKDITKGKFTPGSGGKRIKGDIRVGNDWAIEVKYTSKDKIILKRDWLDKLEREQQANEIALAVFNHMDGFVYVLSDGPTQTDSWKSRQYSLEELPSTIQSSRYIYTKHTLDEFKSITRLK